MSLQLTVGICAYNEEKNIGQLVENILVRQDIPSSSEILIVCSGCTDNTVKIAKSYAEKDKRIRVLTEKERTGKAAAINWTLKDALGANIIFISADTLPEKDCFSKLTARFHDPLVGIVCGKPVPINKRKSLVTSLVKTLWSFHDHVFKEFNDAGLAKHASEVFCIRKGIVNKIPPEIVNDDAYIAVTARKKGWHIKYEPGAVVYISGPETVSDYFEQRLRIIFGHYQIRKLTGETPQYLLHLAPQQPKRVLQLALWLCVKSGIPTFLAFTEIEILLNISAIIDSLNGKNYTRWNIAKSTKIISQLRAD